MHSKGLIINPPLTVETSGVNVSRYFDPHELRRALLFWDKLVWPGNSCMTVKGTAESDFLENKDILTRPRYEAYGTPSEIFLKSIQCAFEENERKNPGCWAISQGEKSLMVKSQLFERGRGVNVELYRAVPIPERDVPLDDILEFKLKRLDEVRSFTIAIDEFFDQWTVSEDQAYQLNLAKQKIELACLDLIKIAKESKNSFRLSSWKIDFSLNPVSMIGAVKLGEIIGQTHGLPELGRCVGGALSTLALSKDIGLSSGNYKTSPFSFATTIDQELF